ncbi:MAG: metal-dependent hydrolase [Halorhabdus sp.]
MVDVLGHVAIGLLAATPAWFLWDRRVSGAFVAFVLTTVMLPDVDLYVPGVAHHGVTHTVVFGVLVSLSGGAVLAMGATQTLSRWWRRDEGRRVSWAGLYVFVAGGLLVGGLSHVFADMLSTAAVERPVEPFWPFFRKPFSLYAIQHYSAPVWNGALLVFATSLHLALYALDVSPVTSRVPLVGE